MRHLILIVFSIFLLSCGSTKTVRQSKTILKGDWVLQNVTHSQDGVFNVTLLQDASKECFEGSTWQFIPNNNTGNYTFTSANCDNEKRYFIFTIQEKDVEAGLYDFLLKPTNEKKKSETNNSGFRFQLSQLSENSLTLQQNVTVDGAPFKINMNFTKSLK